MNVEVKTGFGFFKDAAGNITDKAQLPPGKHPVRDGFTYTEVADQAAFDALEIYVSPAEIEAQANEAKIQNKIRQMAIEALIASGDLSADFEG